MKKDTCSRIKDVTKSWKEKVKPKVGEIEVSNYTVSKSGGKFDAHNSTLGEIQEEEKDIGTWFKNTIWGDVKIQRGVMWPRYEKSADLLILNDCPFLSEQTIEIKTLKNAKNIKSVTTRLRKGKGQSSNILFDITKSSLDKNSTIERSKNYLIESDWLKALIIKNNNDYCVYEK